MTATTQAEPLEESPTAAVLAVARSRPVLTGLVVAGVVVVAMSLVRVVSGATDLTSSGTWGAALGFSVPIGMAALGGLWAERAGVVNIGLEGMMILGTFGAGWIGWQYGAWAGLAAAVGFGAVGGLVHAVATISFGVDHVISGVAINILGLGVTQFLASVLLTGTPNGGKSQSPRIEPIGTISVPFVGEPLLRLEQQRWFLISDVAGIVRGLTVDVSMITVIALLLVGLSFVLLWRTPFGLRLRSVGEDPYAAESLGVKVARYKYVAVVTSGCLAGLGGAFLVIVAANIYREGQTGGRGYIGLAALIFGNWRPGGLMMGAGLFGYTDALQLRNAAAAHALLLLIAVLVALIGLRTLTKRRYLLGGVWLAVAAAAFAWYRSTDVLPEQVTTAAPYVTTLLVLAFASQRLRMPKADGLVYRKGGQR